MPRVGEDESIYRRGVKQCRKYYEVRGHEFEAKRFYPRACDHCFELIWCLVQAGLKCWICNLTVHKKCYKAIKMPCRRGRKVSFFQTSALVRRRKARDVIKGEASQIEKSIKDNLLENVDEAVKNLDLSESCENSLQDFNLIKVIGKGAFAKVFMVELKTTKCIYAMKIAKKKPMLKRGHTRCHLTEKLVFTTVSNYPFFVSLHSCFQTPSSLIYVMELVRGGELTFLLQDKGYFPEAHACFYSAEISLALNFLHEHGIIHRDLKLDNVLFDHDGHIKIADYGLCKWDMRPGDAAHSLCGTFHNMTPEMLLGLDYSFGVDWWALGIILFEMLTGKSPFLIMINSISDDEIENFNETYDHESENFKETFKGFMRKTILESKVFIPTFISDEARLILKGFTTKNPFERLGCHSHSGFKDIMLHPFFKSIDFTLLESKQIPSPYKPCLETDRDIAYFDPSFICEPATLTPDNSKEIDKISQIEFDGFDYVNPLYKTDSDIKFSNVL